MRLLGIVSDQKKADKAASEIKEQFPHAKVVFKPADSTPGRIQLVLDQDTLSAGAVNVEAMERIVNRNK